MKCFKLRAENRRCSVGAVPTDGLSSFTPHSVQLGVGVFQAENNTIGYYLIFFLKVDVN